MIHGGSIFLFHVYPMNSPWDFRRQTSTIRISSFGYLRRDLRRTWDVKTSSFGNRFSQVTRSSSHEKRGWTASQRMSLFYAWRRSHFLSNLLDSDIGNSQKIWERQTHHEKIVRRMRSNIFFNICSLKQKLFKPRFNSQNVDEYSWD